MKDRVAALVGPRARSMWVSTFHSMCVRILRREASHAGSEVLVLDLRRQRTRKRLMTLVGRELDLDPKRYPARGADRAGEQPEERAGQRRAALGRPGQHRHREASWPRRSPATRRRLAEAHALDFDDLIAETVNLLQNHSDVAEAYRRRFQHVLVDEYQDTNHAQYVLVRELTTAGSSTDGRPPSSCASSATPTSPSTRSAGATIRNILEFEQRLPRRPHDPAGTELPLHPDDPERRQRRHRAQRRAASRRTCGRRPAPARRSSATSRRTSTTRPPGSRQQIEPLGDSERPARRTWRCSTGPTPSRRVFEEVFIRVGLPYQCGRRGALLRAPRGPRRAGLPAGASPTRRTSVSLRRILNTPRRGIGERAGPSSPPSPSASSCRSPERSRSPTSGLGSTPFGERDPRVHGTDGAAASCGRRPDSTPSAVLEAVLDLTGYVRSWSPRRDPQDEGGSTASASWSAWPASSRSAWPAPTTLPASTTSSSRCRSWPTPTPCPTPAAAW